MCWALPLLKTYPVSTLLTQYYLPHYVAVSPSFWLMQLGMLLENLAFWLWESHGSQHWSTPRFATKCVMTLGGVGVDTMANPFCAKSNTSQRRSCPHFRKLSLPFRLEPDSNIVHEMDGGIKYPEVDAKKESMGHD